MSDSSAGTAGTSSMSNSQTDVPLPLGHTVGCGELNGQKVLTKDEARAYGAACAAAEREAWGDALSDALQSDLENGVKWLNERAAVEFLTKYPALSAVIRARGEA